MRLGALCLAITACLLFAPGSPADTGPGTIAFAERAFGPSSTFDIYTAPGSGGTATRLTHSTRDLLDPAISPDGKKIAYFECETTHCGDVAHGTGGEGAIFVMNIDGTGAKRLTDWQGSFEPSWSPDGSKIAYAAGAGRGFGLHIWTMNADGTDAVRLTGLSQKFDSEPAWSPDGKTIAFIRNTSLVALDLATGAIRALLPGRYPVADRPVWSPDGKQLAFSYGPGLHEIDRIASDGTGLTRVASGSGSGQRLYPAWSADGTRIAFVLCAYTCYGKSGGIDVVPATGGRVTRLLPPSADYRGWLTWR